MKKLLVLLLLLPLAASARMFPTEFPVKAVCWDSAKEAVQYHQELLGEYPVEKRRRSNSLRCYRWKYVGDNPPRRCGGETRTMSNGTPLNKSLSIGHIITTVALIVGGFTFIYDLRESVAIQAFQFKSVENRLDRVVARTDENFQEIMDHLIRLEEKLDTIVLNPVQQKGG